MRFDVHQSAIDASDAAYGLTDEERYVLALGMSESTVKRRRASLARKIVL